MFLFSSDLTKLDLRKFDLLSTPPGQWKLEEIGGAGIIWLQTPFTIACSLSNKFVICLQRPEDAEPICQLEWRKASEELIVRRRWSGEFSVYVARSDGLVISSHARLAAFACGGRPTGMRGLLPAESLRVNLKERGTWKTSKKTSVRSKFGMSYSQTLDAVREELYKSISNLPNAPALLLSGGLDSSIIAAVARDLGKRVVPFVFSLRTPIVRQTDLENDLVCARFVAAHLGLRCEEILLDAATLKRNVPMAVWLAETPRPTIIDPCTGLIEVAKSISHAGFKSVVIGEAADDLFGSFTFALRYKRGQGLKSYYRRELDIGLPDEMAVLQRTFEPWGVSVVDPFWTLGLKMIGYNLPLSYRLDRRRLMKRILRDAFAGMLPKTILFRPKVITREGTQIRYALEKRFGASRDRYRPIFKRMFIEGKAWSRNPSLLTSSTS